MSILGDLLEPFLLLLQSRLHMLPKVERPVQKVVPRALFSVWGAPHHSVPDYVFKSKHVLDGQPDSPSRSVV